MRCLAIMRFFAELIAAHLDDQISALLWRKMTAQNVPRDNYSENIIVREFLGLRLDAQLKARPVSVPAVNDEAVLYENRFKQSVLLDVIPQFRVFGFRQLWQPVSSRMN
jgi:hypothetical protein